MQFNTIRDLICLRPSIILVVSFLIVKVLGDDDINIIIYSVRFKERMRYVYP
jgi:hypothetical protein